MELQNQTLFEIRERAARRWLLPLLVVVLAVGLPSVWFGPRVFRAFQERRLLRVGHETLASDPVRAVISLRRVLMLNPANVDANRTLAEMAEKYGTPEGLVLRERVCELMPKSYADARAWALAALRFGETGQAEDAFERMKGLGPETAQQAEIGARVALAAGRDADARAGFARVLALDPHDEASRLQLAALDIRMPDATLRESARATLERLRADPALRHAALRALIGERLESANVADALALGAEFVADPAATFDDRLQYLGILRAAERPSGEFIGSFQRPEKLTLGLTKEPDGLTFPGFLNDLENESRDVPVKAAALIAFLNTQGLALLASEWAASLPRESSAAPPIAPALAESYLLTADWARLGEFIAQGDWDRFEFRRLAYSARVLREKGDRAGASAQWAAANKAADYRPERLAALERMASAWGWAEEWEELVWSIARSSKRPREALEALAEFYLAKLDTQKAFTVWSRLLEMDPSDATARRNWSRLSLLLRNDKFRTGTMVQDLYRQFPDDPEIVCSYALLLHFREQDTEALAAMERLGPERLRSPRVAGYYAILLFAKSRKKEAAEFIAAARDAAWLREEQELVDQVRRMLD